MRLSREKEAPMAMAVERIVVVMGASSKEITRKQALEWAMANVVNAGDQVTVVVLWQEAGLGRRRLWGLPLLAGDCASRRRESLLPEEEEMSEALQRLRRLCDVKQVPVRVRIVPASCREAASMEAQNAAATWVVLDSELKKEQGRTCMEKLHCNVVVVKRRDDAKILRLSTKQGIREAGKGEVAAEEPGPTRTNNSSPEARTPFTTTDKATSSSSSATSSEICTTSPLLPCTQTAPASAPSASAAAPNCAALSSAPESDSDSVYDDASSSSEDEGLARVDSFSDRSKTMSGMVATLRTPSSDTNQPWLPQDFGSISARREFGLNKLAMAVSRPHSANATPRLIAQQHNGRSSTPSSPLMSARDGHRHRHYLHHLDQPQQHQMHPVQLKIRNHPLHQLDAEKRTRLARMLAAEELLHKFSSSSSSSSAFQNHAAMAADAMDELVSLSGSESGWRGDLDRTSSVRRAVSLSKHAPPVPPPLCSICQHKGPVFGKPPKRFTYAELELATGGFSSANFLAEGGFGSVHRGILPDGQAVAVKQHKLASAQGDVEFCSEVEVLSCAQHRNVVMLIGYCIEQRRRLLVYEFVCNGSLDAHLYGREKGAGSLGWAARQKIAVGAARGLRYLHEECRVGCIVHRDMRPNNILLTHDFQPMVGDFGLARWQPDGDLGVQTRVIGTFGYMAPEYAQSGQITEKADVYSFGVVLLELATGRKAVDLDRPKGQQCLTEWARPLLEAHATEQLVDPLLAANYSTYEISCMLHAASLCIRKDPLYRPRMSQVLRILEGDVVLHKSSSSLSISSTPSYGRQLAYGDDRTGCGSRSSRMFSEYRGKRVTELGSPPTWMNFDESCEEGKAGKNGRQMPYEVLKMKYKGRSNTRRLSCEDVL